jgi:hypothetical protein
VLAALVLHAWGDSTIVWPSQERLALLCNCTVTTVQRALRRLADRWRLIIRCRRRDADGRLSVNAYDLTPVLSLCPKASEQVLQEAAPEPVQPIAHPSFLTDGQEGESICGASHHFCRIETDNGRLEADNNTRPEAQPSNEAVSEVVVALRKIGVSGRSAADLAARHDTARIYAQIEALPYHLKGMKNVRSSAGMLITAINENWAVPDGLLLARKRAADEQTRSESRRQRAAVAARAAEERGDLDSRLDSLPEPLRADLRTRALAVLRAQYPHGPVRASIEAGATPSAQTLIRREMIAIMTAAPGKETSDEK